MSTSLAIENWQDVSLDVVVLTCLRGEAHKYENLTDEERRLIHTAEIGNPAENLRRCHLVAQKRFGLFLGVPPDTIWYEVRYLRNDHLDQLRVMREPNWNSPTDQNELGKVAVRNPFRLRPLAEKWKNEARVLEYYSTEPNSWQNPILWGHDREGPLTILEGTHRLVWYYLQTKTHPTFMNTIYVGLSKNPCCWHFPDQFDGRYEVNPLTSTHEK